MKDFVPPKGMIAVPTRDGTGVTVGTQRAIAQEKQWLKDLLNSLVAVKCNCRTVEVTLPLKENERCELCYGLFRIVEE